MMDNVLFNSSRYWWVAGRHGTSKYNEVTVNQASIALLLISLCAGFLVLLWVMISFCLKRWDIRQGSVFVVSLLFTAVFQSLSTPVVVMDIMRFHCSCSFYYLLMVLWSGLRRCGVFVQLLVVLEFTLSRTESWCHIGQLPMYVSLPIVLVLYLFGILFSVPTATVVGLGFILSTGIVLAICIISCKFQLAYQHKGKVRAMNVIALATYAAYFPNFVIECMLLNGGSISLVGLMEIFECLTNLRLIMDPVLLWLVCSTHSRERPQPTELALENPNFRQDSVNKS